MNFFWEIKHEKQGIDSPAAGETGQTAGTAPEDPGKHQSKRRRYSALRQFSENTEKYAARKGVCTQPQYQRGRMQSVDQGKAAEAGDTQRRA